MVRHRATWVACAATIVPGVLQAQEIDLGNDWKATVGLQITAFATTVDSDLDGDGPDGSMDSFRLLSGFDPSKLTVGVTAPEITGMTVSGTSQVVTNITDGKSEAAPDGGNLFGVRIAELAVSRIRKATGFAVDFFHSFESRIVTGQNQSRKGL